MKSSRKHSAVDDISPQARRLDSIAWLIQGDNKCGAAYFDGNKLFLATNKKDSSPIVKEVIGHLYYVAHKSQALEESGLSPETISKFKKDIKKSADILLGELKNSDMYSNDKFAIDVTEALYKVTDSIIASYIEPGGHTAISQELKEAIRKKCIEFVSGNRASNDKDIHAEMKLAQKLLETRNTNAESALSNPYIGISKSCCLKCDHIIKAINQVIDPPIQEILMKKEGPLVPARASEQLVAVRQEGHLNAYPCGIPQFLEPTDNTLTPEIKGRIQQILIGKVADLTPFFERKDIQRRDETLNRSASPESAPHDESMMFGALNRTTETESISKSKAVAQQDNPLIHHVEQELVSGDKGELGWEAKKRPRSSNIESKDDSNSENERKRVALTHLTSGQSSSRAFTAAFTGSPSPDRTPTVVDKSGPGKSSSNDKGRYSS